MESLFLRVRKSPSRLLLSTWMEKSIQTPRNLTASASRSSVSAMELLRQGTKQLLRPRNTSLSDMGDMFGEFFCFRFYLELSMCWPHRNHSYSPISPGRFFAANEVKALLAHIVVMYDIKFEEGKQAPRSFIINSVRIPGRANAMFRKRQR